MDLNIQLIQECLDNYTSLDKYQLYKDNGATPVILDILQKQKSLENPKKFGIMMEEIAQKLLNLENSTNSEHDKIKNSKKIEIKTSTMLNKGLINNKKIFQYNSIRLDYDYDFLLLQNINFTNIDYYIIKKEKLLSLNLCKNQKTIKKNFINILRFQDIKDYVIPITDKNIDNIITLS